MQWLIQARAVGLFSIAKQFMSSLYRSLERTIRAGNRGKVLAWRRETVCNLTHYSYLWKKTEAWGGNSPGKSLNDVPRTQT